MSEGDVTTNLPGSILAPVMGLNTASSIAGMGPQDAVIAENVICYPDRVEMRFGASTSVTGFASPVKGLWAWNGSPGFSLWATTDDGVFDATTPGAVGAAELPLTNGYTSGVILSTGGTVALSLINGTDSLIQFDGTTWSAIASFGGLTSSDIVGIEVYNQRMFFLEAGTLTLWYLAINSISGAATSYPLGAIFRRGGELQSIATWTIDAGNGPDDYLTVMTSNGEIAVFVGFDPADPTSWFLRGVYFLGRPVGRVALYKYGGDVLAITESGILPLSKALLTAAVDRSVAVTYRVRQLFAELVTAYGTVEGWQLVNVPDIPILICNIPGTSTGYQLVMHTQTGAWSNFTGWFANCFERMNGQLYIGTDTSVDTVMVGASDYGDNIVSTVLGAFSRLGYARKKEIRAVQSILQANGPFNYTLGVANDFIFSATSTIIPGVGSGALWGAGIWGTDLWFSSQQLSKDWNVVPDISGLYKALYLQISSNTSRVALLVTNFIAVKGGTF